jgi:hypothetical protein
MRIEFRYLYFVPSHVADDRFVVGLLHWDGMRLRFAHSIERIPVPLRMTDLQSELEAVRVRVSQHESEHPTTLANEFQVTEGRGPSLLWGPIRAGQTDDPVAHFEELRSLTGLASQPDAMRSKADASIHSALKKLA